MNQNEATGERELGVVELSEGVLRLAAYRSQCCSEQQQSANGSVATASCGDALPRNMHHGDHGKMSVNVAYFAAAAVSGGKPSRLSLTRSTVCSPLRNLSPLSH